MSALPAPTLPPVLERLQALFAVRNGASALAALQEQAIARFFELGLPVPRDESWKYTSLRRLEGRKFALPEPVTAASTTLSTPLLTRAGWLQATIRNGSVTGLPPPDALPAGIRVRSLKNVLQDDPTEAASLFDLPEPSASARFELLNRAFAADGLVVDVDRETVVEAPIAITVHAAGSTAAWMVSPVVFVRVGESARVTVVEQHLSDQEATHFSNAVTRLSLAPGSSVQHYRLQEEAPQVIHLGHVVAEVGRDAVFVSHTLATGGTLARLDLDVRLSEPGAACELNGIFLASGTQHLDTHTRIDHTAAHTRSSEDYRGIADGRGRGVFNGQVMVRPGAQQIDARQSSRNLLLSPAAEIVTRPELEIHADDVKCSHGATTGQLDPTALFYLRSRAIGEADARALLALAFVEAVMASMKLPAVQEHLHGFFSGYFLGDTGSGS